MSTAAQRTRHREHRESTRHQILVAAERFLRESPYRDLSVDVVMAETGLTRTAFYRHFDDVTALVLRLFADVSEELYAVAQRWAGTAGADTPGPALEGLAGVVDFFVRHGPLMRAISEAAATDEQIERAYRGSLEKLIKLTAETLERMVRDRQLDVPDPHALARAMTLMNEAYLLEEFGRAPLGDRDVALATLETVWLGIAASSAVSR